MLHKRCGGCKKERPATEFWKDRSQSDGLQRKCKPCHRKATSSAAKRRRRQDRQESPGHQRCTKCGRRKSLERFHRARDRRTGRRPTCKACVREYSKQHRLRNRCAQHGITLDDYERMMHEQKGRCRICRTSFGQRPPVVDHCHAEGYVRGLLCGECNLGLGKFRDDPELLREAVRYLERGNAVA